jgi:hypothetical protein
VNAAVLVTHGITMKIGVILTNLERLRESIRALVILSDAQANARTIISLLHDNQQLTDSEFEYLKGEF